MAEAGDGRSIITVLASGNLGLSPNPGPNPAIESASPSCSQVPTFSGGGDWEVARPAVCPSSSSESGEPEASRENHLCTMPCTTERSGPLLPLLWLLEVEVEVEVEAAVPGAAALSASGWTGEVVPMGREEAGYSD